MAGPLVLDPLLAPAEADAVVALWHAHPGYQQYSNEGFATEFAPELAQRYDAAANFVRTGGRFGRREEVALLAARTNYYRETYVYGDHVLAPGAEVLRDHPGFAEAAEAIHGRPVVVPSIVYANILLPGQELAVHTDVPEFRGANRTVLPQWLLVVMHHSGLFEPWRMPIATAIAYFGDARGGELAYYPEGPGGPPRTYAPRHNTAAVLDTDSVFHGVDRVHGDDSALGDLRPGMRLRHDGQRRWSVRDGRRVVAAYDTDDLRYSVSWKGYCFVDEAERRAWAEHSDDLTLGTILDRLVRDLVDRGRLRDPAARPSDAELGRLLIEEYIRFPEPTPATT
jgi:hypothetical protein